MKNRPDPIEKDGETTDETKNTTSEIDKETGLFVLEEEIDEALLKTLDGKK